MKELFFTCYLTNEKTQNFLELLKNLCEQKKIGNKELIETEKFNTNLIDFYYEDFIHRKYKEFVDLINWIIINDPLKSIKKSMMNLVLEMIIAKPEREELLLENLVNKLGDPDVDIANFAIKLLKDLQKAHGKMSIIILKFVEKFISTKNLSDSSAFYSIVFLSQMDLINNKDFIENSLRLFFELFNYYTDKEEEKFQKNVALIVKSLNILSKFCKDHSIELKGFFEEKIDILFKLSHSKSLKLRYQILKLIFYMSRNYDNKQLDRYYKSLYDLLLNKDITVSKHLKEIFLLILESINYDTNITRVSAFVKRLLQVFELLIN